MSLTMPFFYPLLSSSHHHVLKLPCTLLITLGYSLDQGEQDTGQNATCPDTPRRARARVDTLWTRQYTTCPRRLQPPPVLSPRTHTHHTTSNLLDNPTCPRMHCR
jgi:hypothetical protein